MCCYNMVHNVQLGDQAMSVIIIELETWNTKARWSSGLRREIQVFLPSFLGVASPHLERGVGSNPTRVIF